MGMLFRWMAPYTYWARAMMQPRDMQVLQYTQAFMLAWARYEP